MFHFFTCISHLWPPDKSVLSLSTPRYSAITGPFHHVLMIYWFYSWYFHILRLIWDLWSLFPANILTDTGSNILLFSTSFIRSGSFQDFSAWHELNWTGKNKICSSETTPTAAYFISYLFIDGSFDPLFNSFFLYIFSLCNRLLLILSLFLPLLPGLSISWMILCILISSNISRSSIMMKNLWNTLLLEIEVEAQYTPHNSTSFTVILLLFPLLPFHYLLALQCCLVYDTNLFILRFRDQDSGAYRKHVSLFFVIVSYKRHT